MGLGSRWPGERWVQASAKVPGRRSFKLAKTVTSKKMNGQKEGIIEAILDHSQSAEELLKRRKVYYDSISKYLSSEGLNVLPRSSKSDVIQIAIRHWGGTVSNSRSSRNNRSGQIHSISLGEGRRRVESSRQILTIEVATSRPTEFISANLVHPAVYARPAQGNPSQGQQGQEWEDNTASLPHSSLSAPREDQQLADGSTPPRSVAQRPSSSTLNDVRTGANRRNVSYNEAPRQSNRYANGNNGDSLPGTSGEPTMLPALTPREVMLRRNALMRLTPGANRRNVSYNEAPRQSNQHKNGNNGDSLPGTSGEPTMLRALTPREVMLRRNALMRLTPGGRSGELH
ncbi:uncharacterized protein LOC142139450 isoform X2 [Mixophyes fleayi]|uniref:uncharacterized protein LOC142139450 isoform X2 n=1 Tax=Mixophyes fleayi TaxID=3061075 RepID=UPI003F4D720C